MKTIKSEKVVDTPAKVEEAVLPVELLNNVLQYLATRPYSEVAGLISDVHQNSKVI